MSYDPVDDWTDMDFLKDLMQTYDVGPEDTIADLIEAINEADSEEGE